MSASESNTTDQRRCPNCKNFCGVVYRSRGGAGKVELESCINCGLRPPKCSHEDGTVMGCNTPATHTGAFRDSRRDRPWCEEHAPDDAEVYPYAKD